MREVGLYTCVDGAVRKLFESGILSSLTPYYDEETHEVDVTGAKMATVGYYSYSRTSGKYFAMAVACFPDSGFQVVFEIADPPIYVHTGDLHIYGGGTNTAIHIRLTGNILSFRKENGGVERDNQNLRVQLYK